jgi:hypothetical protein
MIREGSNSTTHNDTHVNKSPRATPRAIMERKLLVDNIFVAIVFEIKTIKKSTDAMNVTSDKKINELVSLSNKIVSIKENVNIMAKSPISRCLTLPRVKEMYFFSAK